MDWNKECADCIQNIRSMLGEFIFDLINLNDKVIGYGVATGLIKEDILSNILNDKIIDVTAFSLVHYANL